MRAYRAEDAALRTRLAAALIALTLAGTSGCISAYRPLQGPVPTAARGHLPRVLQVTRTDGTRVMLYETELQGDTLIGWNDIPSSARPGSRFLIRVAVDDVRAPRRQRTNWVASIGLGTGVGLVVLRVAGAASMESINMGPWY